MNLECSGKFASLHGASLCPKNPPMALNGASIYVAYEPEHSNCQFALRQTQDGKMVVMVQFLHETISSLRSSEVGFELLGGTRTEQAKRLTDLLNEYVIGVFVSQKESKPAS